MIYFYSFPFLLFYVSVVCVCVCTFTVNLTGCFAEQTPSKTTNPKKKLSPVLVYGIQFCQLVAVRRVKMSYKEIFQLVTFSTLYIFSDYLYLPRTIFHIYDAFSYLFNIVFCRFIYKKKRTNKNFLLLIHPTDIA